MKSIHKQQLVLSNKIREGPLINGVPFTLSGHSYVTCSDIINEALFLVITYFTNSKQYEVLTSCA